MIVSQKPDHAEPTHVSKFIREELEARGWTRQEVYDRLGYDAADCLAFDLLMDVEDKNILLNERLSKGLGFVFSVSPELFIRLHEAWRSHSSTPAGTANVITFAPRQ